MRKPATLFYLALLGLTLASCDPSGPGSADAGSGREIVFTTQGDSFSPMIEVDTDAVVRWTWADGTTSAAHSPTKSYGSVGARRNRLLVTPWSALKTINLGYDGGDGGTLNYGTYLKPDQRVSAVENLDLVRDSLVVWCSSYNNIPTLDFSGFSKLETIECYLSNSLYLVNLDNTPALRRACFEDCDLLSLDVTGCPNLEDLRGAVNDYETIAFGPSYSRLWHICVRDNGSSITDRDLFANTQAFPAIRELFIWNDNQSGALRIPSTGAGDVDIAVNDNSYESADFSGALMDETSNGIVSMRNNRLTSVNISGCDQINALDLANNQLPDSQVDAILAALDTLGRSSSGTPGRAFSVNLSGNAAPSAAGDARAVNLRAKGWTVVVTED
jgi:hypothetical protein